VSGPSRRALTRPAWPYKIYSASTSASGHGETKLVRAFLVRSISNNGRLAAPQIEDEFKPFSLFNGQISRLRAA